MRAVVMREFGAPEVLLAEDLPDPEPGPEEAVVRVAAVEVSATRDAGTRSGRHPFSRLVTLPHVLGGDCAGTVVGVGPGVEEDLVGARVAVSNAIACHACRFCLAGHDEACENLQLVGVHRPGSYAEYLAVPAANLTRLPDGLGLREAAALAADGAVAYAQLEAGGVGPGTRVLVCGAAGALGSTLVTLAAARGAHVIALSRRAPELLARWGAATTIASDAPDLTARLLEATDGAGVDVVVDNVALPAPFAGYMPALAVRGRVVMSGAMGPEPIAFAPQALYLRSQSIVGLRTESRATRVRFWGEVAALPRLAPDALATLPLEEAVEAHHRLASGAKVGHLLLEPASVT